MRHRWLVATVSTSLLALLLGMPLLMGMVAEKQLNYAIKSLNGSRAVQAKLVEYHRGWFHSKGELSIDLIPSGLMTSAAYRMPVHLMADLKIAHGPLAVDTKSPIKLRLARALVQGHFYPVDELTLLASSGDTPFKQSKKKHSSIEAGLVFKLLGATEGKLRSLNFNYQDRMNQTSLAWDDLWIRWWMDRDQRQQNLTFQAKNVRFDQGKDRLVMAEPMLEYHIRQESESLWQEQHQFKFTRLEVHTLKGSPLKLDGFSMHSKQEVTDGEKLDTWSQVNIEKILSRGKPYGPGSYRLSMRHLDMDALERVKHQFKALQLLGSNSAKQVFFEHLLTQLFSQPVELNFQSFLDTPSGKLQAKILANLSLDGREGAAPLTQQLLSKLDLVTDIDFPTELGRQALISALKHQVKSQLKVQRQLGQSVDKSPLDPASLAKRADLRLNRWSDAGLLKTHGSHYQAHLSYHHGSLSLNGVTLLPMMAEQVKKA